MKGVSLLASILKTFRHSVQSESSSSSSTATRFLKPNPVCAILQDLCSKKKTAEAEKVLEDMNKDGLAPDEKTYKSLFELFCDQLRKEKGYKILRDGVGAAEFSHSFATYNMIVLAYCNVGMVEKALEILRDMIEKGVEPNLVSFKAVLKGLCKTTRKTEAEKLVKEMNAKGLATDTLVHLICQYQEVYFLHTDARYYPKTGKGCISGIFRDIRGNFLRSHYMKLGKAEKLLEEGGSSKAEAIGVRQSLLEFEEWMKELGIPLQEVQLKVRTDSKNVRDGVNNHSSKCSVVKNIRKQIKNYKHFEIENVEGETENVPAHNLAKFGWEQKVKDRHCVIVKEVEELTTEIWGMLDKDKERLTIFKENQ